MKYQFIDTHRSEFSVMKMCLILDVSTSAFYEYLSREKPNREIENERIVSEIKIIHKETAGLYGSPRILHELRDRGFHVNEKRVARLMAENEISGEKPKVFRVKTTDSNHDLPISPDLVQREFEPGILNRVWVTDITYIETLDGFAYLTTFLDVGNREIVGWHLSSTLRTEGVIEALKMAVRSKNPASGLIVHSDRGSQYASKEFRDSLSHYGFRQSMSRKGNCYDNAVAESFFHTMKNECIYRIGQKVSRYELNKILFDYIEVFYNRTRRHSTLGYLNPVKYAKSLS